MENTNSDWDTLGEDIVVDRYRPNGTVAPASDLALQMCPGDIVLHWWSAPDYEQSLVDWSIVVGFPTLVDTTPHDSAITGIRIEVPLCWQSGLRTVVDLRTVRSRAERVLAVADLTHAGDDRPAYFPSVRRGNTGIKGVSSHYITRFPSELLEILPGLPSTPTLTNAASAALRAYAITDTVHDPRHAAALREHSLAAAIRLLSADSYNITDVSGFRGSFPCRHVSHPHELPRRPRPAHHRIRPIPTLAVPARLDPGNTPLKPQLRQRAADRVS